MGHKPGEHFALDFSSSAARRGEGGVRLEMKVCEGFCGGLRFYRPVAASAKSGEKLCAACVARVVRRKQASQRRVAFPPGQ